MPAASDGPKKTMYHSELVQMGEVAVTVVREQQQSKYKGKAPFVTLNIGGEERFYNCENDECARFFDGTAGTSFILQASGTKENASLDYIDEAEPAPAPPPRAANRPPARQAAPAAQRPPAARPTPQAAAQAQKQAAPANHGPMGVTVGMAINNACAFMVANKEPFNPALVAQRASDILRLAAWLELGNLMPKQTYPAIRTTGPLPPQQIEAGELAAVLAQPEPEPAPEPEAEPAPGDDVPF